MRTGFRPSVVAVFVIMLMTVSAFAVIGAKGLSVSPSKPIPGLEDPMTVAKAPGSGGGIARTWTAPIDGYFHQWLENNGLKGITIYMFDITSTPPILRDSSFITFSEANAFPTGTVQLATPGVIKDHVYKWTFTPSGKTGTSAKFFWMFEPKLTPPVATFTMSYTGTVLNVDATGSYDPDGTIVQYAWNWGDGTTSTGVTASHQYVVYNGHSVTLTVTDNDGLTNSITMSIPPPLPFTIYGYTFGSDGYPRPGSMVTLSDTRTGAVLSAMSDVDAFYQIDLNTIYGGWQVGDTIVVAATQGTASGSSQFVLTSPNPIPPYMEIDITLYGGVSQIPPVALFSFSYSGSVINVDASASYDRDGTIVQYAWNWGDGALSSGVKSSHRYEATGGHSVKLTVTDNDGLTGSLTQPIPPAFPFIIFGYTKGIDGAPIAGCSVGLTNVVTGAKATTVSDSGAFYSWDLSAMSWGYALGDVIVVTATSGTMSGSGQVLLTTLGPPYLEVDITLAQPGPVAEAGPIQYLWGQDTVQFDGSGSSSAVGIVSYVWTWIAGNGVLESVTGINPTISSVLFFSYGNYTVTLTITDSDGRTATDTVSISWGFRLTNTDMGAEGIITPSAGYFKLRIENHGMTSFDWTIIDCNLTSPPYDVFHERVTFSSADQLLITDPVWMLGERWYQSEYDLTGPAGSYMTIFSFFVPS